MEQRAKLVEKINQLVKEGAVNAARVLVALFEETRAGGDLNKVLEDAIARRKEVIHLSGDQATALEEIKRLAKETAQTEADLAATQRERIGVINGLISAEEARVNATEAVADALQGVTDAEKEVTDLLAERAAIVIENATRLTEARNEALARQKDLLMGVGDAIRAVEDAVTALDNAQESLADAEDRVIEARHKLLELFKPADARELAAAERDLLRAELSLEEATEKRIEAEQNLQRLLTRKQNQGQRLETLGLDELNTMLSNARASAAAARTLGDEEELRDEVIKAKLAEADAADRLVDSQEELNELREEGHPTAREVADANEAINEALEDQFLAQRNVKRANQDLLLSRNALTDAQKEYNDSLDTEKQLAPVLATNADRLARIDERIASARDRAADAGERVVDARNKETIAIGRVTGALRILNGEENAELRNLRDQIDLYAQLGIIGPAAYRAAKDELGRLKTAANTTVQTIVKVDFEFAESNATGAAFANFIRTGITENVFSPLAEGGVITRPTFAQLGEGGLKEVVLPLTKPARALALAQQSGFMDIVNTASSFNKPERAVSSFSVPSPGTSVIGDPDLLSAVRKMNTLLESSRIGDDIDINLSGELPVNDRLKMRKLGRQIEKAVRRGR